MGLSPNWPKESEVAYESPIHNRDTNTGTKLAKVPIPLWDSGSIRRS